MSYKPTPVTAKIQKTTKGGVCNPLLNVGTVAKMKGPSVANKKFSTDPKEKAKQKQWIKDNPEKYKELIAKKRKAEADSKARKEGEAGWAADDKARKDKTGLYAENKTNGNSGDGNKVVKKKAYVKKGGKATGNMKDYKVGSQARRDEYTARGWKQDDTTKVVKKKATKTTKTTKTKKVTANNNTSQFTQKDSYIDQDRIKGIATGKIDAKPPKEEKKKLTKSQKLRAKGNAVLADKSLSTEERQKKSRKIRRKYDRTVKRETKKANKKTTKVKYDPNTGTGGSVAGNLLRSITGERKRDREAAAKRKAEKNK